MISGVRHTAQCTVIIPHKENLLSFYSSLECGSVFRSSVVMLVASMANDFRPKFQIVFAEIFVTSDYF